MPYEDPDEYDIPSHEAGMTVIAVLKVGAVLILCGIAAWAIMGAICM